MALRTGLERLFKRKKALVNKKMLKRMEQDVLFLRKQCLQGKQSLQGLLLLF
jgi:hypothetical protein